MFSPLGKTSGEKIGAGMVEITMGMRFIAALSLFLLPSGYFVDNKSKK